MGDPLSGFDMGPEDIFYEGPQKPVVFHSDSQDQTHNTTHVTPQGSGDLANRVARLEEQVRRLVDLVSFG